MGLYHASTTRETKSHYQRGFSGASSIRCLVATVAFGMVSVYKQVYNETNALIMSLGYGY